jgi:hypothetical protein
MQCFEVWVPEGRSLRGVTANGQPVPVYPGEYLVHRLAKAGRHLPPLLRFVGADAQGRDVHVPLDAASDLKELLAPRGRQAPQDAGDERVPAGHG